MTTQLPTTTLVPPALDARLERSAVALDYELRRAAFRSTQRCVDRHPSARIQRTMQMCADLLGHLPDVSQEQRWALAAAICTRRGCDYHAVRAR